jgi:hypothetical protein
MAGDYLQLGPNDYVQFPSGLDQAGKEKFAQQAMVAYKTQQGSQVADNQAADLAYAQQNGTSLLGRRQARAADMLKHQTTPQQVLNEDNNPITQGLSAMGSEATAGAGDVANGSLFQKIIGLARIANAPAVGAGQAVGTTTQKVLANIPEALGGGAAGVIPAAGAALADAGTQLFAGPAVIRGATNTLKSLGQGAAQYVMPGAMREAGMEAVAGRLGQPVTSLERVLQTPASKAAYALAESQGPVKTLDMADTIEQAFLKHADLSNPNQGALRYLSNLEKKLRGGQLAYGDAMEEIQGLKARADSAFASRTPEAKTLGTTLMQAREMLLQEMDKVSPLYRSANRLMRQESATKDIMNAIRTGAQGVNLEKLLENSPDIAASFGPQATTDIMAITNKLNSVASTTPAGGFRQLISAMATPLTNMMASPVGRSVLRWTVTQPSDRIPRLLAMAVQTYKATGGTQESQ